jgi:hypothetical protein
LVKDITTHANRHFGERLVLELHHRLALVVIAHPALKAHERASMRIGKLSAQRVGIKRRRLKREHR